MISKSSISFIETKREDDNSKDDDKINDSTDDDNSKDDDDSADDDKSNDSRDNDKSKEKVKNNDSKDDDKSKDDVKNNDTKDKILTYGIEIVDTKQILTKSQKQKIKQWIKDNKTNEFVLQNIHYLPNIEIKYNHIKIEEITSCNKKKIILEYSTKPLQNLLHQKIKTKTMNRKSVQKSPCWKLYYKILDHPTIRSLPYETIEKAIPNPDQVKEKRDVYRMINGVNPNPIIKNYIQECLAE